jgi:hypothetical protein
MRIAWASPAHTSPRTLPLPARESYEVRIAGGRVGFEAGRSAGAGEITLANVGVTDLTGRARRLGNLGEGSLFSDDFDFDGSRLTWWTYGCTRAFVHVVPAAGPAAISPARTGCPLRFSGPATVSRGMVRVQVDCFGFAGGVCTAQDVTLVVRRAHRRVVVGRGHSAGRVKLTPAGRALLRRRRLLRVSASATLSDDAGRRERRAGRIALAGSGGQR